MRLAGKVAVITGAAGGQGAAAVELFAKEGAKVVITDINKAGGEALAKRLSDAHRDRILFVPHDVTSIESWTEVADKTIERFGALHILVNNAGIIDRQKIDAMRLDAWNRVIAVNLTGPMIGTKICAPHIKQSGGGSIVNVSSIAGLMGHYDAAYSSSKWGLRGFSKAAAVEYVDWKIRVNSIHPAQIVGTTIYENAPPGFAEANRQTIPMQRQGTPEECAYLVLFLASDESSFITGAEIAIDGGFSSGGAIWMRSKLQEMIMRSAKPA